MVCVILRVLVGLPILMVLVVGLYRLGAWAHKREGSNNAEWADCIFMGFGMVLVAASVVAVVTFVAWFIGELIL